MKKTSAQWHSLLETKYRGSYVMDPDGWDRKNYDYSFYQEQITEEEFWKRFFRSTVSISPELLKDMQNNVNIVLGESYDESKCLLLHYFVALDEYRTDPNRTNKDLLLEAEYECRKKVGLSTDGLGELYRTSQ